jgi:hypothetical protein
MRDELQRMHWAALVGVALLLLAPPPGRAEDGDAAAGTAPRWMLAKPDQIQWQDAPSSLPPGAKVAILEGDPAKDGFFAMRIKFPDGYRVMPHWHPNTERLTILQGVVHLGTGDRFDASATQPLGAGTYSSMPPKMTHFAWMEGETILQLNSLGPWQVVYVDPVDDPRNKH